MKVNTSAFIKIWKILHYVSIVISILFFILYFLPPAPLNPLIPYVSIITGFTFYGIYLILSILILYGIYKKSKVGYYSSMIYILLKLIDAITDIIWGINYQESVSSIIGIVRVVFLILIGYFVYKIKDYFGIKNL